MLIDKAIYPVAFQIPDRDREAMILHVESQILAHHAETNHAELRPPLPLAFRSGHNLFAPLSTLKSDKACENDDDARV